eukprot:1149945-Pelagomonas_calceolata.AAC.4
MLVEAWGGACRGVLQAQEVHPMEWVVHWELHPPGRGWQHVGRGQILLLAVKRWTVVVHMGMEVGHKDMEVVPTYCPELPAGTEGQHTHLARYEVLELNKDGTVEIKYR